MTDRTQYAGVLNHKHNMMKWVSQIEFCVTTHAYTILLSKKDDTSTLSWLPAWRYLEFKQMKAHFHKREAMGNPFIWFACDKGTDPSQHWTALLRQVKVCQTGHEGDSH